MNRMNISSAFARVDVASGEGNVGQRKKTYSGHCGYRLPQQWGLQQSSGVCALGCDGAVKGKGRRVGRALEVERDYLHRARG